MFPTEQSPYHPVETLVSPTKSLRTSVEPTAAVPLATKHLLSKLYFSLNATVFLC
jgi:hypothetical protein